MMKSHHYAAITVIVVLIGIGYVLTVWMNATLGGDHQEADTDTAIESTIQETTTSESDSATTSSTEQTSAEIQEETDSGEVASQETESTASETSQTTTEAQSPETETTETSTSSTSTSSGLSLMVEQLGGETDEASIAIELKAVGQPIDLSGWRLSDAIGAAGHIDHRYYFGNHVLSVEQPLTIFSACGRDQDLRLYWCLSSPLAIFDAEQQELFLHNERGDLIFTCTPIDPTQAQVRYECA